MGRHHVDRLCPDFFQILGPDPPFVGGHRHRLPRKEPENPIRLGISGVFESHRPLSFQQAAYKHEQKIVACAHDELVCRTVHPPGSVQIADDGLPKLPVSLRLPLGKDGRVVLAQNGTGQPSPDAEGEKPHIHRIGGKIRRKAAFLCFQNAALPLPFLRETIQLLHPGHKIAPVRNRLDIALREQLIIGQLHRTPGNPQIRGQRASRGKLLPIEKLPLPDLFFDVLIYLFVKMTSVVFPYDNQILHQPFLSAPFAWPGSLKELFRDTIRLNTGAPGLESL